MSLTIDWELDTEDPVSAESLLGRISLSNNGEIITEDSVYLDSWLEALARAASDGSTTAVGGTTFEIPEESTPLKIKVRNGILIISFRDRHVHADSTDDFQRSVARAARDLLDRTQSIWGAGESDCLKRLSSLIQGFRSSG